MTCEIDAQHTTIILNT